MPKGLITSLLLKLTVDFWYFTVLALLVKILLIRFTVTDSKIKVFLIWLTGSITFYIVSCIAGIVFSSAGFYFIPVIMFFFATISELLFTSLTFKLTAKRLMLSVLIGDSLFFLLLFMQMM